MSLVYFDSSVVLSFLLNEKRAGDARALWAGYNARCSSILLEAEVWVGLRRQRSHLRGAVDDHWLETRLQVFSALLKEISLVVVDSSVTAILRSEPVLAECRTLDAVHLATALRARAYADDNLRLATFDDRMATTARRLSIACFE